MIDRIEYQVDHAVEYVDRANRDMKKAREYESKARKVSVLNSFPTLLVALTNNVLCCFLFTEKVNDIGLSYCLWYHFMFNGSRLPWVLKTFRQLSTCQYRV